MVMSISSRSFAEDLALSGVTFLRLGRLSVGHNTQTEGKSVSGFKSS